MKIRSGRDRAQFSQQFAQASVGGQIHFGPARVRALRSTKSRKPRIQLCSPGRRWIAAAHRATARHRPRRKHRRGTGFNGSIGAVPGPAS